MNKTYVHTAMRCPACDKKLDASTEVDAGSKRPPEQGDVTICMGCGEILEYAEGPRLVKVKEEIIREFPPHIAAQFLTLRSHLRGQRRVRPN